MIRFIDPPLGPQIYSCVKRAFYSVTGKTNRGNDFSTVESTPITMGDFFRAVRGLPELIHLRVYHPHHIRAIFRVYRRVAGHRAGKSIDTLCALMNRRSCQDRPLSNAIDARFLISRIRRCWWPFRCSNLRQLFGKMRMIKVYTYSGFACGVCFMRSERAGCFTRNWFEG